MSRRVVIDVVLGLVLAAGAMVLLYGAYLVLLAAGAAPYEAAPPDPGSRPDWLSQINLMSLLAAVPALVATFVVARLLNTGTVGDGVRRGLIWAGIVIGWTLLIAVGNGTVAMFGVPGLWVYFAAFVLGPVAAGRIRIGRAAAEPPRPDPGGVEHPAG